MIHFICKHVILMCTFHVFHHIVIFLPHCPFCSVVLNYLLFLFFYLLQLGRKRWQICVKFREHFKITNTVVLLSSWCLAWFQALTCVIKYWPDPAAREAADQHSSLPLWSGLFLVPRHPPVLRLCHSLSKRNKPLMHLALHFILNETNVVVNTVINSPSFVIITVFKEFKLCIYPLLQGFLQFWCSLKPSERPHTPSQFLVVKTNLTRIHLSWKVEHVTYRCINHRKQNIYCKALKTGSI